MHTLSPEQSESTLHFAVNEKYVSFSKIMGVKRIFARNEVQ